MAEAKIQDSQNEELKYAGFWMRVAANIIDSFITQTFLFVVYFMVLIIYVVFFVEGNVEMLEESLPNDDIREMTKAEIVLIFSCMSLFAFYYIIMNATNKFKATLGKYALDMQVLDLNGNKISYMRSFWRYFFSTITFLLALVSFGLPYIIVVFNKKKRALHDFLAGTIVVRKY